MLLVGMSPKSRLEAFKIPIHDQQFHKIMHNAGFCYLIIVPVTLVEKVQSFGTHCGIHDFALKVRNIMVW